VHDMTHGRDRALAVAEQHGDAGAKKRFQCVTAFGAHHITGMQKVCGSRGHRRWRAVMGSMMMMIGVVARVVIVSHQTPVLRKAPGPRVCRGV